MGPLDNTETAEHIRELKEQIGQLTRQKQETEAELSSADSEYTAQLEQKVKQPKKGPSRVRLDKLKGRRSTLKLNLTEIEARLHGVQQVLATVIRYKGTGRLSDRDTELGVTEDHLPAVGAENETAVMDSHLGERSEETPRSVVETVSPSPTASSLSIGSGFGKVSLSASTSPEPAAMLGVIEHVELNSPGNYDRNVDNQKFRAMSSTRSPIEDGTSQVIVPGGSWVPQVERTATESSIIMTGEARQVVGVTPAVNQPEFSSDMNVYGTSVMNSFPGHNYEAFQERTQAQLPLQVQGSETLPPLYTDVNQVYGLDRPLLRSNFIPGTDLPPTLPSFSSASGPGDPREHNQPTLRKGTLNYSFNGPGPSHVDIGNAGLSLTPQQEYGVLAAQPAAHGYHPSNQPQGSIRASTTIGSGLPYTTSNRGYPPSQASLSNRPHQTRVPMPPLNHPTPKKPTDGLHQLSSALPDMGSANTASEKDAGSKGKGVKRERKITNIKDARRHRTKIEDSDSASLDRPVVGQATDRELTPKERIEGLIVGSLWHYMTGQSPLVDDTYRKITRENDSICSYAARISRRVSVHLLSNSAGNFQCLYHHKNYNNAPEAKGKPWGAYDEQWILHGEATGDRVMGSGQGKKPTPGCTNCGCPIDLALMHWILQKTWKVTGTHPVDGTTVEEGMKGEMWKQRTRLFIVEQWKKIVSLELDDYFIGEEALLKGLNEGKTIDAIFAEFDCQLFVKRLMNFAGECAALQPSGHLDAPQVFALVDKVAEKQLAADIKGAYTRDTYFSKHEWDVTSEWMDRAASGYGDCARLGWKAVKDALDNNHV